MKSSCGPPRDGDQLRLALFDDVPWDGITPRVLTKGHKALSLRQKPPRHEVFFDPEQRELELSDRPHREKSPTLSYASSGASLLLEPLPRRSYGPRQG